MTVHKWEDIKAGKYKGVPVVLFRKGLSGDDQGEMDAAASAGFAVYTSRSGVPANSLVVARYSCLPYYKELSDDLDWFGSRLCNTVRQHHYVADINNWTCHLQDLTPMTWGSVEQVPESETGPFFLKGATNSRKDRWLTHAYAQDRAAMLAVRDRLMADPYIDQQGIVVRQYMKLRKLFDGVTGMPVTNEWRYFIYNRQILCGAYYWANYIDEVQGILATEDPAQETARRELVTKVIDAVGGNCTFYAVDVAELESGGWVAIELNDGQMSGLSCNTPKEFYVALKAAI